MPTFLQKDLKEHCQSQGQVKERVKERGQEGKEEGEGVRERGRSAFFFDFLGKKSSIAAASY